MTRKSMRTIRDDAMALVRLRLPHSELIRYTHRIEVELVIRGESRNVAVVPGDPMED
ncbi:MAG TPA: hypothetical protein VMS12_12115 [Thermoanaerobaculia bacterium]|nr:hypothetical protein [Thermoanaerobaculia bacterium]